MMVPLDRAVAQATMEAYFNELASRLSTLLAPGEDYTARFSAETSDFVRLNRGRIRQPGSVTQRYIDLDLIRGARHATHTLSLSGNLAADHAAVAAAVAGLRATLPDLGDDPHLALATEIVNSRDVRGEPLPPAEEIIEAVLNAADGLDLVGLYAGGPVYRGFANAMGQRNWHEATCYNLNWSLYHRTDKAVKSALSGLAWSTPSLVAKMDEARDLLAHIAQPAKSLPPGRYRAYLAPAAMEDIVATLSWDGFSARAHATRQSPLSRMRDAAGGGLSLDPRVHMAEATADGVAAAFQHDGFARPARIPLIDGGALAATLVSPRTALEFGAACGPSNGANGAESPEALAMAGGDLPMRDALAALGTGLFVGNLHYLNFSDRTACRMTGMTRFATFWVEDGRIKAPVDVLRFDDTIYRMLGTNLEALTAETEFLLDNGTYRQRALASVEVPGALLSEMAFTL